eukprot:15467764-Alexandrium_andersonii.AAC.1
MAVSFPRPGSALQAVAAVALEAREGCTTRGLCRPAPACGHTGGCACAVLPCSFGSLSSCPSSRCA